MLDSKPLHLGVYWDVLEHVVETQVGDVHIGVRVMKTDCRVQIFETADERDAWSSARPSTFNWRAV